MRKTITILGDKGDFFPEVMEVLMKQDLRLLFVSEDEGQNSNLKARLEVTGAVAEVEFTTCERDGCWEADIIVITQFEKASSSLLKKIKEVATQKIVLVISGSRKQLEKSNLQQLLSYSKVIEILMDSQKKEFSIFGKDNEAVQEIFESSGYQMQR